MNAYDQQPVSPNEVSVRVLLEGESPYRLPVDAGGCLTVRTRNERVRLVVRSSYYKNDTLVRVLNKANPTELVALETDDYAWMIRLFSSAEVGDWQQRRAQLDSMLAPDARIYQLFAGQAWAWNCITSKNLLQAHHATAQLATDRRARYSLRRRPHSGVAL